MGDPLAPLLRQINAMGEGFADAAREEIANEIRRVIAKDIGAGRAPDGTPWPVNADGGKPLKGAEKSIKIGVINDQIIVKLGNNRPLVLHHFGYARGGKRRQLIPDKGAPIPDSYRRGIERALQRVARRFGLG